MSPGPLGGTKSAVVARIPYINSLPFYIRWLEVEERSERRWRSTMLPPRQLGQEAAEGRVDAGLMSVVDMIRLERDFEPLAIPSAHGPCHLGLACRNRVDSVLLFLRTEPGSGRPRDPETSEEREGRTLRPDEAASLRGAQIAVTADTSTSILLLRLLLETRYASPPSSYVRADLSKISRADGEMLTAERGHEPSDVIASDGPAAVLVIGDEALRWSHRPPPGYRLGMDLASEWHAWTGLPFVFACWAVRRDLESRDKEWLARFLDSSLEEASGDLSILVVGLPENLGSAPNLARYLEGFTYRLGPSEIEALGRFRGLLIDSGLITAST